VILGFALLAPADVALAQISDASGPSDVEYQTVIRRLKPGQKVRVTTSSVRFPMRWAGASLEGISGALPVESSTALSPDDGLGGPQDAALSDGASIQWSEIQRIDVRGRATSTGWPIGLVMGALGGVAVGVGLSQMTLLGGEPTGADVEAAALYFGAAGAIGGALAGAIIGTAFPKWHAIYKQSGDKR